MARLAAIALAVVLASGCKTKEVRAAAPRPTTAHLFVTADLRGYLAPCGCSEAMKGGLPRAAHQIATARATGAPVLYVDSGDALFGQASFEPAGIPQAERKAQAVAAAFLKMGLSFRTVGELDEARGADFRAGLGLPEASGDGFRLLDAGGHPVGVAYAKEGPALVKASQAARAAGAQFVLALLHQPWSAAQEAAELPGLEADLIVAGHVDEALAQGADQLARSTVPVAKVEGKGRSLMRLELAFAGAPGERFALVKGQAQEEREAAALSERIELLRKQLDDPGMGAQAKAVRRTKLDELVLRREETANAALPLPEGKNAFQVRFIPLETSLESDPAVKELVAAYDREVGELNLAWAKEHGRDCPLPSPGQAAYLGNAACQECHAAAFPVWEGSRHAGAYRTLEKEGKNFNLECVKCHVTGPDAPGGVCRIDQVEGRKGVGCESCHGPGSLHAKAPTRQNIATPRQARDCVGCHDPENSRHFQFEGYLRQVVGPGHGQPAAR